MKQDAMLLSIKKSTFNDSTGRPVNCGKVQLGIPTDNGFEPVDYYCNLDLYDEIKDNVPVGEKVTFIFKPEILYKKIKLVGIDLNMN